ncbi:MAG: glycosyltransferase family 2 protein [Chloroflexi bacterium]|nr:glycosyltransferase family 2 protein [Chloroflexota bacterium]
MLGKRFDTRSADATGAIAERLGARVVPHPFEDFARQRNVGLDLAEGEWIFYLDTDERCSPALAEEIRAAVLREEYAGWWVPRRNIILGREVRYGGWYPDYQLRLLRRGRARYDLSRPVHEVVQLQGPAGYLQAPLLHYNYRTMAQFRAKQRQYIGYEAQIRYQQGIRPKPWTYFLQPLREFWRRYVTLKGYRDGLHGLRLCALVAYYYGFLVTVRLGRLWRSRRG